MTDAPEVRVATGDDLNLVEPLWVAVHHQHAETMPELAPYVSDAETWAIRRQLYEELLAKPDTVLRHRRRWQRSRPGAASSYSASRRKSAPEPGRFLALDATASS
jgi:hypothetical protein